MALTVQWKGGDDVTTIASGSYIGFYGATFNSSVPLNNYNKLTVSTNSIGTSNLGTLPNVRYTTPGYAVWTGGSGSIYNVPWAKNTLHIRITSGSAVRLSSVNLIAYANNNLGTSPIGMVVRGFEKGNTSWKAMGGLASPLPLTPHTSSGSTVHDYYVSLSVSPTISNSTALLSFALVTDWY